MSQSVLRVDHDDDYFARGPVTEPIRGTLVLSRPLGNSTWLARLDDTAVTARLVTGPVAAPSLEPPTDPQPRLPDPRNVVAFFGTQLLDGAAWSVSEFVAGVSLDRLLGIAILTPAQAVHIASSIFTGLADLHAAGLVHGSLTSRKVMIGTDGTVRLSGWAAFGASTSAKKARVADLDAGCAVVTELVRNADRPVGRHHPGGSRLLVQLERLASGGTPADAHSTATALADGLAAADGVTAGSALLCAELGALSNASIKHVPGAEREPRPPQPTRRRPRPTAAADQPRSPDGRNPLSGADWGRSRRGRLVWGAAVVVLVVAGLAFTVGRGPITSLLDRVLHRTPASTAAQNPGSHNTTDVRLHPVPAFGPPSAGVVRQVTLHPTAPCRPGHACPVRIHVRVAPSNQPHRVSWRIVTVNRCTRKPHVPADGTLRARGTFVLPAGTRSASAERRIALPKLPALGVVAVTHKPARAASEPVRVPPRQASC